MKKTHREVLKEELACKIKESKFFSLYNMLGKKIEYSEQPARGVNLDLLKVYGDKYSLYWPVRGQDEKG